MATYSTEITASWGGSSFSEVTDIAVSFYGGPGKGRVTTVPVWTDEVGNVSVTAFGGTNMSTAEYGKRAILSVSGGGVSLTNYAVYESLSAKPELNGVTRYTATFRLLDG